MPINNIFASISTNGRNRLLHQWIPQIANYDIANTHGRKHRRRPAQRVCLFGGCVCPYSLCVSFLANS